MSLQQEREELDAFRRFLQCGAFQVDDSSIESRRPPEPDILCATTSGARVAFELVEVVEPLWAQMNSDRSTVQQQFQNALSDQALRDPSFADRYRDTIVAIQFFNSGARRWAAAIPAAVEALNSVPSGFEGLLERDALDPQIAELRVSRQLGHNGPVGQVLAIASAGQPIVGQVEGKWRKAYETPHRIELLAYFGLQAIGAPSTWLPEFQKFAGANWASSPFQRVWVCNISVPELLWSGARPAA